MSYLIHFLPIITFVVLFVGSGLYFTAIGVSHAFYQFSPVVAILPAIALAWIVHRGSTEQKMHDFLDGLRHRDIVTMCIIFLLAGAFSQVTQDIGSVASTINFALSLIPSQFLLIGLFLVAAFVAVSIGTSMGTIATIAPIGFVLSHQVGIPAPLCMGTVVGGALFGDNLSIISDTTIAAVMSQHADMKKKLVLNAQVAFIASCITMAILMFKTNITVEAATGSYNALLITPYLLLIALALWGVNVFVSLSASITFAGLVGSYVLKDYGLLAFSKSISTGFASMHEIMLLSLLVGGLSGLAGAGFTQRIADNLSAWIFRRNAGTKTAQLLIAALASIFDTLLANNTIAIIVSGQIAREIAKKHLIPAHYSAAWLDIFSCVFQGLIPYGAQILLASAIAQISPLSVVPYVYYCYALGFVSVAYIICNKPRP